MRNQDWAERPARITGPALADLIEPLSGLPHARIEIGATGTEPGAEHVETLLQELRALGADVFEDGQYLRGKVQLDHVTVLLVAPACDDHYTGDFDARTLNQRPAPYMDSVTLGECRRCGLTLRHVEPSTSAQRRREAEQRHRRMRRYGAYFAGDSGVTGVR